MFLFCPGFTLEHLFSNYKFFGQNGPKKHVFCPPRFHETFDQNGPKKHVFKLQVFWPKRTKKTCFEIQVFLPKRTKKTGFFAPPVSLNNGPKRTKKTCFEIQVFWPKRTNKTSFQKARFHETILLATSVNLVLFFVPQQVTSGLQLLGFCTLNKLNMQAGGNLLGKEEKFQIPRSCKPEVTCWGS